MTYLSRSIPKRFLYTTNSFPPLKVYGFDKNEAILKKLEENDTAFMNSDRYYLPDIPVEYQGLPATKINKENFILILLLYVAYLEHYPFFLTDDFENTSQMQIDTEGKMLIYKKKLQKGKW